MYMACNGDQPMFYMQLYNLLMEFSTDNILIRGDLNVVFNPDLDNVGGDKILSHAAEALHSLIDEFDFTDIHRLFHPYTKLFTWRHWKPVLIFTRLDYFLTSSNLTKLATKSKILLTFSSDNSPIWLGFHLDTNKRGPGFWKFNLSFLTHKDFKELLTNIITTLKKEFEHCDQHTIWDMIKLHIHNITIPYTKNLYQSKHLKTEVLEHKLHYFKNLQPTSMFNADYISTQTTQLKTELQEIWTQKTYGAMIHSKATWYNVE